VIKTKKIFLIIILTFFYFSESSSLIKDSIFATVGNKAITKSDILDEIKIILILSGRAYSEDKKEQLKQVAIQTAIKRKIKQIEIDRYNFTQYNQSDLKYELNQLAVNLNTDLETLKGVFETNKIDFEKIINQLKTELQWNGLIFKLYSGRLQINIDEIDEKLKLIQDKKEIEEYLISEIIVRPSSTEKVEFQIKKIKEKIKNEGFENAAIDISISETALKGGDLGWVNENIISEEFKSKITNTPVGNISDPIFLPEGILFFKIRDKRKLENILNLEDAKNQIVNAEKTKILNMHSLSHYDNLKRSISIDYY
tara:strand:- start:253 stop:1188 length:936 start_codon:yes stop_codon:yes gene_type:complete